MHSYEAINKAIKGRTVEFAKRLRLSTPLLNKWQEPTTDYTDSGAYNPLDRIEAIIETSLAQGAPPEDAYAPLYYLAEKFNHIVIPIAIPHAQTSELSEELLKTVKEFGDLSSESATSLQDGRITRQEYARIDREAWHLIRQVACFLEKVKESVK
jgi:hypothetical protein